MIIDKVSSDDLPSRITDQDLKKIVSGENLIGKREYVKRYNHKGSTIWITGLHGLGKNELAYTFEKQLFELGVIVVLLDGKSVRSGPSRELDFSPADSGEHLRRLVHICSLLYDQGIITICSFISPIANIRQ